MQKIHKGGRNAKATVGLPAVAFAIFHSLLYQPNQLKAY